MSEKSNNNWLLGKITHKIWKMKIVVCSVCWHQLQCRQQPWINSWQSTVLSGYIMLKSSHQSTVPENCMAQFEGRGSLFMISVSHSYITNNCAGWLQHIGKSSINCVVGFYTKFEGGLLFAVLIGHDSWLANNQKNP